MAATIAPPTSSNQQTSSRSKKSTKDERVNSALRFALSMHEGSQSRWDKLIAEGAHDNQIWHALLKEFGQTGGGAQTDDGVLFAYIGGGNGIDPPLFWVGTSNHRTQEKPTLKGAALVKRVRELLQIPELKPLDDSAASDDASVIAPPEVSLNDRAMDLAFLADLEDEQKGRWTTIVEYDRLLAHDSTPKRDMKRLRRERKDAQNRYEDAWDEAVKALDNNADIVQDVRDRVEAPDGSTIAASGEGTPKPCAACEAVAFIIDPENPSSGHCTACLATLTVEEGKPCPPDPAYSFANNPDLEDTPAMEIAYAPARRFTRSLECELSDSDLLSKLEELTTKLTEKDAVERELKEVSAGYKGRIKTLDREVHALTRVVTRKHEERDVECEERFDYDGHKVELIRLDTFAVIETRNMTPRERQQHLFAPSI